MHGNSLFLHTFRWRTIAYVCALCVTLHSSAMAKTPSMFFETNGIQGIEIFSSDRVPTPQVAEISAGEASSVLPFSVWIRNSGPLPVTGIDIRFQIITGDDAVVRTYFYGSPDITETGYPVLAPGAGLLITPEHIINNQLMNGGRLSLNERARVVLHQTIDLLAGADRIEVSVDSVIHADGILRGPDRSGTLFKFQQRIDAYSRFRNELLRRLSAGDPDQKLIAWLQEQADQRVVRPGKNLPVDHGQLETKTVAQEYATYLQQGRRNFASEKITADTPEKKLKRIIKVRREEER